MAKVNQVDKRVKMDLAAVVRFQLITHCFLEGIAASPAELDCLTLLAMAGEQDLNIFCKEIHEKNIFKSTQTVRNVISKACIKQLVVKEGKTKKTITINPELNLQVSGNVLLDFKFLGTSHE